VPGTPSSSLDEAVQQFRGFLHADLLPATAEPLDRLGAYGLVPKSLIRLHQKKPSFVVQLDETDLALDRDVASDIYVRRIKEPTGDR